ncbi:mitochondrial ribosomal protein S29 [Oratosquilla oratoria]|uniref:mitochondrial ribosomal protein S29 n=1 Tax=Oratosquilla oratoria TaxID=337810 RepID=UPI003F76D9B8
MATPMRRQGYAIIRLFCNNVYGNHGPRSFSTSQGPDVEHSRERSESFRTNIHSPSQQTSNQLGQWYTLEPEKLKKYFTHGGLPKKFMDMGPIFNETAIMVRKPTLKVIEYTRKADYTLPPIKYILYGPNGAGKSLCIAHLVHYFGDEGWVLIHVPWAPNWSRRFKEITPSTTVPGRYDHTIDAAVWLQHFRSQNLETLKSLQLTTTDTYNWSRREITEKGSSLLDIVEQGISRARFASDCTMALTTELKKCATEGRCKIAVVIDGINSLYCKESRYQREDKVMVPPQDFTLYQAFTQLINTPWKNGCIVGSVDTLAVTGKGKESHLPRYLLGKEGWDDLDPFVPVQVENYNDVEMTSAIDYMIDRSWIQNPAGRFEEGRKEIQALCGFNPYKFVELCRSL